MKRNSLLLPGLGAICLLMLNPGPAAGAADCEELRKNIQQERNLIRKQQLLDEAVAACPQDARIHYEKGYGEERLRRYDQALSYYLRAVELDPDFARAFFGLGDVYVVLGNLGPAIQAYEAGLALDPDHVRARSSLELAQIKYRSERGEQITPDEFVRVMQESRQQGTTAGALDGPLLRMQILFQINSAELTASAKEQLAMVGAALTDPALSGQRFEIAGHTDSTGSPEVNLPLSKERAEQVRQYLMEEYGVSPERLTIAYYGDTRPAVPNDTAANRAINRRVEFRRLSD
ncbi:OmpA family protein [Desulfurivibrio dismutans]|uniref:OmpA family protein n=1 Tax=Desulfurivibrio dismutans TaxID=1398908 RepID=UPI0023DB738D|nr:OmpA family protein [Desulfurivibrio alkaliphilus]MDF1615312.1 OmpA family protein [Desulfurivibrio alkaliphilus]